MPPLSLILAAINAGVTVIPEGARLVASLKALFGEKDATAIDAALVAATARADLQHSEAQGL